MRPVRTALRREKALGIAEWYVKHRGAMRRTPRADAGAVGSKQPCDVPYPPDAPLGVVPRRQPPCVLTTSA